MTVDLSAIDLSRVTMADFNERGLAIVRLDSRHFSNANDAVVHGTIVLAIVPGTTNQARVALNRQDPQIFNQRAGMFNFEMQSWGNPINWIRNPETFIGGLIYGSSFIGSTMFYTRGTPFPIFYHGTVTIPR